MFLWVNFDLFWVSLGQWNGSLIMWRLLCCGFSRRFICFRLRILWIWFWVRVGVILIIIFIRLLRFGCWLGSCLDCLLWVWVIVVWIFREWACFEGWPCLKVDVMVVFVVRGIIWGWSWVYERGVRHFISEMFYWDVVFCRDRLVLYRNRGVKWLWWVYVGWVILFLRRI